MTWSKTPEQMGIQPCEVCGEDTSFGSGRFVNRIPADDNYMCSECQMIECDKCNNKALNYETTINGEWICEDCLPDINPELIPNF